MWFFIQNEQVKINIFAKPNAKKTALLGVGEQGLQISLHAKPHQGEANEELISFLSKLLRIPKKQIILQRGEGGRHKQIILPLTSSVQQLLDNPNQFI
jgi:uncharacterized protein